jgi:hypothetical protein
MRGFAPLVPEKKLAAVATACHHWQKGQLRVAFTATLQKLRSDYPLKDE